MRKLNKTALILALTAILTMGVIGVQAEDDDDSAMDDGRVSDGRVNYEDPAAPVAIYCVFEYTDPSDPNLGIFTGIDVLQINSEGQGEGLLYASTDLIAAADPLESAIIAETAGAGLYLNSDGYSVITPAYSFSWQPGAINC